MTDLEMTKLCAEAMELFKQGRTFTAEPPHYDPIHKDVEAMELIKKFHIAIGWNPGWAAFRQDTKKWVYGEERDLNYTICLCVAKMQASKKVSPT